MTFAPERWLGGERYSGDDLAASQPFSMGARGCIGKVSSHYFISGPKSLTYKQTLAYAEIRSILTRIIWNFDMELKEDSMNWGDQKVYTLWHKSPLNIKLWARKFE